MRPFLVCSAFILTPAFTANAAPALGDKPPRWEYAELTFRNLPGRPAGTDADGKEIPAVPASVPIRWISGAGEIDVKGWDALAAKLKAPSLKKGTAAYQKIQILNYLGSEGWELMEQQTAGSAGNPWGGAAGGRGGGAGLPSVSFSPGTSTWLFKRQVP